MPKFTVQEIIEKFDLKILYKNNNSDLEKRVVSALGINRGGLELTGFKSKKNTLARRVILLSSKETEYLTSLKSDNYESNFINILEDHVPAIFVSSNFGYNQELAATAQKKASKVPIIKFNGNSSEFASTVGLYITEHLAPSTRVHGTLVNIFGYGVLITGESGIGKSETTLDLIRSGHLFIGDDSIDLWKINNKIIGKVSDMVKNFIEIRGIGILDVTKMYGYHVILAESQIHLIIELISASNDSWNKIDRLGDNLDFHEYFGVKIPKITIPVTSGRNLADLIGSSVISLKLKAAGQDSAIKFKNEIIKNLKSNEKK